MLSVIIPNVTAQWSGRLAEWRVQQKKTDAFHFLPDILNSRYTCVSMYGRERGGERGSTSERERESRRERDRKRNRGAEKGREKNWEKIEGERKK